MASLTLRPLPGAPHADPYELLRPAAFHMASLCSGVRAATAHGRVPIPSSPPLNSDHS